jgi:hypothetical protein
MSKLEWWDTTMKRITGVSEESVHRLVDHWVPPLQPCWAQHFSTVDFPKHSPKLGPFPRIRSACSKGLIQITRKVRMPYECGDDHPFTIHFGCEYPVDSRGLIQSLSGEFTLRRGWGGRGWGPHLTIVRVSEVIGDPRVTVGFSTKLWFRLV